MGTVQTGMLWRIVSTSIPNWWIFDAIGFERDVSNGTRWVETELAIVMADPQSFAYLRAKKEEPGHTLTVRGECLA